MKCSSYLIVSLEERLGNNFVVLFNFRSLTKIKKPQFLVEIGAFGGNI